MWTYTHDAEGNVTKRSKGASSDTWVYTYDHRNQMLTAAFSLTDGGAATQRVTYAYDAAGARILREGWDGSTATTERYVLDGGDPQKAGALGNEGKDELLVLDALGNVTARYGWGTGYDEIVVRQTGGGAVSWELADFQGSVKKVIDNSASTQSTASYSATGVRTAGSVPDFGYTGVRLDGITGMYSNGRGEREREPEANVWMQRDRLGVRPGEVHPFQYVRNNPTNATDPSGQELYVQGNDVEKWKEFAKNNPGIELFPLHDYPSGMHQVIVKPEARTPQYHAEVAAFIGRLGYSPKAVGESLNAMYGGWVSARHPGYSRTLDRHLMNGYVSDTPVSPIFHLTLTDRRRLAKLEERASRGERLDVGEELMLRVQRAEYLQLMYDSGYAGGPVDALVQVRDAAARKLIDRDLMAWQAAQTAPPADIVAVRIQVVSSPTRAQVLAFGNPVQPRPVRAEERGPYDWLADRIVNNAPDWFVNWAAGPRVPEKPSTGASFVPVIGPIRMADYHMARNEWGWAVFHIGVAAFDVVLVGTAAKGVKALYYSEARLRFVGSGASSNGKSPAHVTTVLTQPGKKPVVIDSNMRTGPGVDPIIWDQVIRIPKAVPKKPGFPLPALPDKQRAVLGLVDRNAWTCYGTAWRVCMKAWGRPDCWLGAYGLLHGAEPLYLYSEDR